MNIMKKIPWWNLYYLLITAAYLIWRILIFLKRG